MGVPKEEGGEEDRGVNRWQARMDAAREVAEQRRQEQRQQKRHQAVQSARIWWRGLGEGVLDLVTGNRRGPTAPFDPSAPPVIRPPLPPPPPPRPPELEPAPLGQVAVVGAGVAGLVTAFRLRQAGIHVTVYEAAAEPGGQVRTYLEDGFFWEAGAAAMEHTSGVASLIADLGLQDEAIYRRNVDTVAFNGRAHKLPGNNPLELLLSPLVSVPGKVRMCLEPIAWMRPLKTRRQLLRPGTRRSAESAHELLTRHFGEEATRCLYGPVLKRQFGADPMFLSAEHCLPREWADEQRFGSLLLSAAARALWHSASRPARALLPAPRPPLWRAPSHRLSHHHKLASTELASVELPQRAWRGSHKQVSFLRGLQTLPIALAARIGAGHFLTGAAVQGIEFEGALDSGHWKVLVKGGAQQDARPVTPTRRASPPVTPALELHGRRFDSVVLALPAHALPALRVAVNGYRLPLDSLPTVEYTPLAKLLLVFPFIANRTSNNNSNGRRGPLGWLVKNVERARRQSLGPVVLFPSGAQADGGFRHPLELTVASHMFPHRNPRGSAVVSAVLGGDNDTHVVRRSRNELVKAVLSEMSELGEQALPGGADWAARPSITRHVLWRRAVPLFRPGYADTLDALLSVQAQAPGVVLTGAHMAGAGLGQVVQHAHAAAEQVVASLVERSSARLYAADRHQRELAEARQLALRQQARELDLHPPKASRNKDVEAAVDRLMKQRLLYIGEPDSATLPAVELRPNAPLGSLEEETLKADKEEPVVGASKPVASSTVTASTPRSVAPPTPPTPEPPRRLLTRADVRSRERSTRAEVERQLKEEKAAHARARQTAALERRKDRERLHSSGLKVEGEHATSLSSPFNRRHHPDLAGSPSGSTFKPSTSEVLSSRGNTGLETDPEETATTPRQVSSRRTQRRRGAANPVRRRDSEHVSVKARTIEGDDISQGRSRFDDRDSTLDKSTPGPVWG